MTQNETVIVNNLVIEDDDDIGQAGEENLSLDEYEGKNVLSLQLQNFTGPMDLLLKLVSDAKIEIKDIFISEVTNQFLKYMEQLDELDVDKASEYMYIAATLMEIKSHKMLPVFPGFEDPNEQPESLFIKQLEEYKLLRDAAEELKTMENPDRLFKVPDKSAETPRFCVKDLSLENLLNAFASILNKVELREIDKNTIREIKKESFSVKDKMHFVKNLLVENSELSFFELFNENSSRNEIIVTFFALLELTKLQIITIKQSSEYGDIIIQRNNDQYKESIDFDDEELI